MYFALLGIQDNEIIESISIYNKEKHTVKCVYNLKVKDVQDVTLLLSTYDCEYIISNVSRDICYDVLTKKGFKVSKNYIISIYNFTGLNKYGSYFKWNLFEYAYLRNKRNMISLVMFKVIKQYYRHDIRHVMKRVFNRTIYEFAYDVLHKEFNYDDVKRFVDWIESVMNNCTYSGQPLLVKRISSYVGALSLLNKYDALWRKKQFVLFAYILNSTKSKDSKDNARCETMWKDVWSPEMRSSKESAERAFNAIKDYERELKHR